MASSPHPTFSSSHVHYTSSFKIRHPRTHCVLCICVCTIVQSRCVPSHHGLFGPPVRCLRSRTPYFWEVLIQSLYLCNLALLGPRDHPEITTAARRQQNRICVLGLLPATHEPRPWPGGEGEGLKDGVRSRRRAVSGLNRKTRYSVWSKASFCLLAELLGLPGTCMSNCHTQSACLLWGCDGVSRAHF